MVGQGGGPAEVAARAGGQRGRGWWEAAVWPEAGRRFSQAEEEGRKEEEVSEPRPTLGVRQPVGTNQVMQTYRVRLRYSDPGRRRSPLVLPSPVGGIQRSAAISCSANARTKSSSSSKFLR
jgi:hypothetical protein